MVETLSYGTVKGKIGSASMVLGWTGVVFYIIVVAALGVLILFIIVPGNGASTDADDASTDAD